MSVPTSFGAILAIIVLVLVIVLTILGHPIGGLLLAGMIAALALARLL